MSDTKANSSRARRRRTPASGKSNGQTRMLDAAIDMLCRQPPSGISGRKLAKNAGVHHTLIGQTFGTVAKLLAAAYARERAALISAEFNDPLQPLRPFTLSDHERFWRAHTHFLLDPYDPAIVDELATDSPVVLAARALGAQYPKRSKATARDLAAAWWALHIGALVFEEPLTRGLGISPRQRDLVQSLSDERFGRLIAECPDKLTPGNVDYDLQQAPLRKPQKKLDAREWSLIEAAADLLTTRADAGISGRELARLAGVNYGLIHYYFGTKDAVFDQAFIHLHKNLVSDVMGDRDARHVKPFRIIAHAPFLRAWAMRELANVTMPPVNLVGMGSIFNYLLSSREVDIGDKRAVATVQADAYCSFALQVGWVLCGQNVAEAFQARETVIRSHLLPIVRTFLKTDRRLVR